MTRSTLQPVIAVARGSRPAALVACLVVALLLPAPAAAGDAERELAAAVAAQLTLVAAEGKQFNDSMDALARARLRVAHNLEESLARTRQANELELRAWTAVGASNRLRLFAEVVAATDDAVALAREREARRERQRRQLATAESALDLRVKSLHAAAKQLAALARSEPQGVSLSQVRSIVDGIGASARSGSEKATVGELLSAASLAKATLDSLAEQKRPSG